MVWEEKNIAKYQKHQDAYTRNEHKNYSKWLVQEAIVVCKTKEK